MLVGNITVRVDNEVLAAVRRYATERNSTVNALVREYLINLAAQDSRAKRARVRLRRLSWNRKGGSAGERGHGKSCITGSVLVCRRG